MCIEGVHFFPFFVLWFGSFCFLETLTFVLYLFLLFIYHKFSFLPGSCPYTTQAKTQADVSGCLAWAVLAKGLFIYALN